MWRLRDATKKWRVIELSMSFKKRHTRLFRAPISVLLVLKPTSTQKGRADPELSQRALQPGGDAPRSPMYCWCCWLCAAMACSGVLWRLLCEPLSPGLSVFWAGRYLGRGHMCHHEDPATLPRMGLRSRRLSRMCFSVCVCIICK